MMMLTDEELRIEATYTRDLHDPANQSHNYDRCGQCAFTRHPCDTFVMAEAVLELLDRIETT